MIKELDTLHMFKIKPFFCKIISFILNMTNVTDSQCRLIAIFGFFGFVSFLTVNIRFGLSYEAFKQIIRFAEQTKQESFLVYFKILHRFWFPPLVIRLNPLEVLYPSKSNNQRWVPRD